MKPPKDLDLERWWIKANCKGLPIKRITPEVCAGCEVYRECLWSAMTEDDRMDHGMFIRGGLTGNARDTIWSRYQYRSNKMGAFAEACNKVKKMRVSIVRQQQIKSRQ